MKKEEFFSQIGQFKKRVYRKLPSIKHSIAFADNLVAFLFPVRLEIICQKPEKEFERLKLEFNSILMAMGYNEENAFEVSNDFMETMPDIYANLITDVSAIYEGDPAARSIEEIIITYPGFLATCIYRLAHELYKLQVPVMPRIFSEYAHSITGIDIHPGATIGQSFCIDHGTGIVIGETAEIGSHVKIYQGVTIGALSIQKNETSIKRHPTIKDHVIIYAGATILGGNTTVGENAIIGGNVWLIESVEPRSVVTHSHKVQIRQKKKN
ncbi:MAG: serine acetyltransferase [Bacteroidetes bacterium HGW-Bacteroidetes-17]|jgi:serine O-acetyltransferase|nr:MAG: serine acetyltransferase [Bacteroidetes bacterium HGW-Bacteroidetes-17]